MDETRSRWTRQTPRMRHAQVHRRTAPVFCVVLGVMALLAGCASAHTPPKPTPTVPTPTITPLPASPLTWQPVTLPQGFAADHPATNVLDVAPSDGDIAYACFEPADTTTPTPQLWVTHDRATSWTPLALPASLGSVGWCSLLIDAANPRTVIVGLSMLAPGLSERYGASFDGGATWQTLALSPDIGLVSMASHGSTTYALEAIASATGTTTTLVASGDHLHSWHAVDKSFAASGTQVTGFWVNPATGALLAQVAAPPPTPTPTVSPSNGSASPTASASATVQPAAPQPTLWLSANGGSNWSQAQAPVARQVTAQPSASGQVWRLCAGGSDPTGVAANQLACSADGGRTWRAQTALSISYTCTICTIPVGSQSTRVAPATVFALPSDGAVLAISPDWYGSRSEIKGYGVYRLTSGAAQWQSLGPAPQPAIRYGPSGATTVIWALPSTKASLDPQGRVFIATYP